MGVFDIAADGAVSLIVVAAHRIHEPRAVVADALLILGTHARDTPIGGYSDQPRHVVSVLEGIQNAGRGKFQVDYAEAVRLTRSHTELPSTVKELKSSE